MGAEGSLILGVRPAAAVPPRYSSNHRPFRRTRRSVRPAPRLATESQIEPWFARPATQSLASSDRHLELKRGERCGRRLHRDPIAAKGSRAKQALGLIVKQKGESNQSGRSPRLTIALIERPS